MPAKACAWAGEEARAGEDILVKVGAGIAERVEVDMVGTVTSRCKGNGG